MPTYSILEHLTVKQLCNQLLCYNFVIKILYDMAMTINSSPVLTGESARAFVEEAERNGKLPTPGLSPEREAQIAEFLRKSREFIFPPKDTK